MKTALTMNASLSPQRWDQVQRLFDAVVDLDSEQRAARLDDACRDDTALRDEVDSLLAAYARADEVLQDLDQMGEASPFTMPADYSYRTALIEWVKAV